MTFIIALIFTLVVGTLIYQSIVANFLAPKNVQKFWYYIVGIFTFYFTYEVGLFVGALVWGTTKLAFKVLFFVLMAIAILVGAFYLYTKIRKIPFSIDSLKDLKRDPNVKEAKIISVEDNK